MNENTTLISECMELVKRYNQLGLAGQSRPTLSVSQVKYSTIHPKRAAYPKSVITTRIIDFYEQYTTQIVFANTLKDILALSIDEDDHHLSLIKKESKELQEFNEIRDSLIAKHQAIIDNLSSAVDGWVPLVGNELQMDSNHLDEILKTVYICMKQEGLASVVAIHEAMRPFVYVGSRLIEFLYKLELLTPDQMNLIRSLNEDLKEILVGVRHELDMKSTFNHLQTFGVVPVDSDNKSLQEVIAHLLNTQISDDADLEIVSSLLKQLSMDSGTPTGIIIYVNPHPDLYFNLQSLSQVTKGRPSSNNEGITVSMIHKFDIIKLGDRPTAKASFVQTINVDANTKRTYVLWTNNLTSFKWREDPIDETLLKKILRLKPSQTIEQYNKLLESAIGSLRELDGFSFNRVKYMSFTESVTEEGFLDILTSRIVSCVVDQLEGLAKSAITDVIVADAFADKLIQTFNTAKEDLGIPSKVLSAHCHIIYASISIKAISKIKKALVFLCTQPSNTDDPDAADMQFTKPAVEKMVKMIIQSNDNIYSRVIASHYLHLA